MAPEVLLGRGVNKPADLYGFALTAWELYTAGAVPFASVADPQLFYTLVTKGERPARPVEMGDEMWDLVRRCWRAEPAERPEFGEVEGVLKGMMKDKGQFASLVPGYRD